MVVTLIILALSAVFFVSGKIRSDVVALCALVLLLLFHILTPDEALSGFSNSVVIMMIGLFVVGGAIFQTGLAKMISGKILQLAGKSETRLFILVMLVTSAIGAFVSNTGTVALMLPIVVSLAANAHINSSRLLMPLAFASSMGGMMTLIGTPPNLVIQNALTNAGFEPLTFFSFLPVGLICVFVGMVVLMPLSKIFLTKRGSEKSDSKNKNKSLNELAREYQLSENLFRIQIPENDCRVEYSPTISFEYIGGTAHCFVAVPVVENGQSEIGRSGYCITLRRCVVCEWRFRKSEGVCFSIFFGIIGCPYHRRRQG